MTAPSITLRQRAWDAAAAVPDPELPMLTIAELGILRAVEIVDDRVEVSITPTYSGCPAMTAIALDIDTALHGAGIENARVRLVLSPAWTTDWLTAEARAKLVAAGIAPPGPRASSRLFGTVPPPCPRCGSTATERIAEFGATACKSLWRCTVCREPFDHFKCH
ncbi:MAG TPA: 1,2-phenylacetyl-CoA epoxidase subunit PaaD [Acidiphilium sp.]